MDEKCDPFLQGIMIGLVIGGGIIGLIMGAGTARSVTRSIEKQAIDAGVAEYSIDKTTGAVTFTWIKK
jgi:hypothetical protein